MFPHLYEELESGEVKVPINAVRKNPLEAETAAEGEECACDECHEPEEELTSTETPDKLRHFNPQAVDFQRNTLLNCGANSRRTEYAVSDQKKKNTTTSKKADSAKTAYTFLRSSKTVYRLELLTPQSMSHLTAFLFRFLD